MSRAAPFPLASGHRDMAAVLSALIFGLVGFVVLYPGANLLLSSFQVGPFEAPTGYGLDNWHDAFASRYVVRAIYNTLSLSLTRQAIAFVLGVLIAWLIARTNLPGATWLEFGFWIALFMPALPVAMSWVLLAGSRSGLLNPIIERLPFVQHSGLNIYSWWGIVWVHLMTSTLAVKVFLLVPAFRNMDASLEDAARTCGSNIFGALIRVVVPIMMPTIAVVTLLGLIRSMQAFEVELILGTPAQI